MNFINFGSLNIDRVMKVKHFSKPGETIKCIDYQEFAGGKGLNQSIALKRAGAKKVFHTGKIGKDGEFLKEILIKDNIDTTFVYISKNTTGQAIIQVDENGQNSIIINSGSNEEIDDKQINEVINQFNENDILVIQNEISNVKKIIYLAYDKGLKIIFNPSPIDENIKNIDFNKITWLILNEIEIFDITSSDNGVDKLLNQYNNLNIILTMGEKGVLYKDKEQEIYIDAFKTNVVDTTAAGDTFTGYFIAILNEGKSILESLRFACAAAAIAISKSGASTSIPFREQVEEFLKTNSQDSF